MQVAINIGCFRIKVGTNTAKLTNVRLAISDITDDFSQRK